MAKAADTMNALQTKAGVQTSPATKEPKSMKQWIQVMKPEIEKALPSVITPERFTRIAMTAISSNAKLANSTPQSFLGAMMQAAQLGLEPNTPLGQAYLIPFKNNKKGGVIETQFQIGYKGLIDLAHRSGEFKNITAHEVCENDEFNYEYGLHPVLEHRPALEDRGKVIAYYAVYTLVNGGFEFIVASKEDIDRHARKFSQAYNSGPWKTDFDAMAKKTVIKQLLKYAPIKTEFVRQVSTDESVIKADKNDENSILNTSDFTYSYVEADDVEVIDVEASDVKEVSEESEA